uniref:Glycosyltransferase 2-like domain-containing protein n=1 Tax=Amphora coffeiformis TaxID=265554 RepID=A0A7S3P751_9STRA|mmetsp:Transcript_15442/g.31366  ORF Transcript_15442/g.31366 Transcript_15442/m.31366 type:complete len:479 (-) Transcript_15442:64-1500(-)|eukprot:scaffold8271_cov171-Amphora_coffeaeformis.AAC.11
MALLPTFDIGIPDSWINIAETILFVIWLLFLPMLGKYLLQITAAICSILWHVSVKLFFVKKNAQDSNDSQPRVSVIVPAYNEEVGILKTIHSVLRTNYPNLQLIVVNDGSTDGTHKKISKFLSDYQDEEAAHGYGTDVEIEVDTDSESLNGAANHPVKVQTTRPEITYLSLENGGKAAAMNTALKRVNGSIVITVDADSVMDKKAILRFVECFGDDENVAAVAGNVVVANRSKPIGMIQQLEYLSGFFFKRADSMFNAVYIIGGAAASYRKHVLDTVGGFDASIITEDIELSTRIISAGYKTRYAPGAVVYTEGPSEWMGLCNQRLRWKYGRLKTFWKHRNLFFRFHTEDGVRNNWYLTWLLLPLALYGEFLLTMDWFVLPFCITYVVLVNSGLFLAIVMMLAGLSLLQILVDCKRKFHANLLLLAPMTWFAALSIELVEFQALIRSLRRILGGQGLKWQKWRRVGINENELDDDDDE